MKLSERQGSKADKAWLWKTYVQLLKEPITKQWGWNIDFQEKNFNSELETTKFTILSTQNTDVAAYIVEEKFDHYYLRMLLVSKQYQNKGIGSQFIEQLKTTATTKNKTIKLSVIKANPVLGFYTNLGFLVTGENDGSIKLAFTPRKN